MSKKGFSIDRWLVVLVSAFLIGLLSMPNHMSTLTIHMEQHTSYSTETSPNHADSEHEKDHHALSVGACCPFCIFIVFQSNFSISFGDNLKVADSTPVFHVVYIKSIFPPPKA